MRGRKEVGVKRDIAELEYLKVKEYRDRFRRDIQRITLVSETVSE